MLYPKQHLRVFFVLTPSEKYYAVNAIKKGVYTDEGANIAVLQLIVAIVALLIELDKMR